VGANLAHVLSRIDSGTVMGSERLEVGKSRVGLAEVRSASAVVVLPIVKQVVPVLRIRRVFESAGLDILVDSVHIFKIKSVVAQGQSIYTIRRIVVATVVALANAPSYTTHVQQGQRRK
jgi:hypothetical protein